MSNYTGRFVWVGMEQYPFEGDLLLGVFTSLTKGKKALGDGKEWKKYADGTYERIERRDIKVILIKVKTDEIHE